MSAKAEVARLLKQAGVTPYRRVGKVRVAHDPRTPAATLEAAVGAVKRFAPAMVDGWGEPTAAQEDYWRREGFRPLDVCDDPPAPDVDPMTCPVEWLVGRAARYHFRFTCPQPGQLLGVGLDGWDMDDVRPLLPRWYAAAARARRSDLIAHFASAREPVTEGDRRRAEVRGV
ncbi:MAG: hypothetical protein U0804_02635 [Gemmataceae bacterium]